eukprot:Trichotokara_eunicae@DN6230_c0_g1_i10.p1
MEFAKLDTLAVVLTALAVACTSEGVSWFFFFRKDDFKELTSSINRISGKLDAKRETMKPGKKETRLQAQEETLKRKIQEYQTLRMKAGFSSSLLYIVFVPMIYQAFDGIVVAKLPFVPILMFRTLAHQSLGGNDFTDCSMMFLYVVSLTSFRANIQKLVGNSTPKAVKAVGWEAMAQR